MWDVVEAKKSRVRVEEDVVRVRGSCLAVAMSRSTLWRCPDAGSKIASKAGVAPVGPVAPAVTEV